ncbi:13491_t:CDS:2 [Dentiscutata heterogama]|uniref:13491_t:CDS:1 n=1 Tax=Dentiscutata heterogama TaxID=1316150 RepID=A0ACA9L3W7_9GLOM|nr:13491_t:CDS:2 [Dentiscutata heterogama]
MEIDKVLDEAFERLKLVKVDDAEIMLYKFILLTFVLGCVNNFTTDWKRSIHNFYENKVHNISKTKKASTIKNVWRKYNLAKEGKDIEDFFKFLKNEAIKYDLQRCIKIYDTMSKVSEAIKNISNMVILSGVIDTRKISRSLKAHLELRDVWHHINEDIVVHDIPAEFEKHIERVVLDDDDRIPDEHYNNSSNRKFMKEEYQSILYPFSSKNLWENPTYKKDDLIIESTWNHDFVGPAIDYVLHGIKICRNWDNRRIESTLNIRCKSKKGDFQGYMRSVANKTYNYEIIFGETSYGPNHPNNSDHIYEDQVRIRSLESLHIPLEAGPNSLEYIKKIIKALYNYRILVKETVKKIDSIDVELATLLESVTQSDQIQAEIPIYETP